MATVEKLYGRPTGVEVEAASMASGGSSRGPPPWVVESADEHG
jgi:hypothetical protein